MASDASTGEKQCVWRIYRSTWGWLAAALLVLLVANVPGTQSPPHWSVERMEHGWPLAYAVRDAREGWANPWTLSHSLEELSPVALLVDLAVAAGILWLVARWSQRRARAKAPGQVTWPGLIPWRLAFLALLGWGAWAAWSFEQGRILEKRSAEAAFWNELIRGLGRQDWLIVALAATAAVVAWIATRNMTVDPWERSCRAAARHVLVAFSLVAAATCWVLWRIETSSLPSLCMLVDLAAWAALLLWCRLTGRAWRSWRERWKRRPPAQFSLRFMLVTVLVCAVAIAAAVDDHYVARCQSWDKSIHGWDIVPHWKRPLVSLRYRLLGVFPFYYSDVGYGRFDQSPPQTDEDLACFQYMIRTYPNDTSVTINDELTPKQIHRLPGISSIRFIVVEEASEKNIRLLSNFDQARRLFVRQSKERVAARQASYDMLRQIVHMQSLEQLSIYGEHIDDAELAHVRRLTQLKELNLTWLPGRYSSYWRRQIATPEYVYTAGRDSGRTAAQERITDDGLASLATLEGLERLNLEGTRIAGPGLAHLHRLPRLRHLALTKSPLTDESLAYLNGCHSLISLDLRYTQVQTLAALDWNSLPHLRIVHLTGTEISENRLAQLRRDHPQITFSHHFHDSVKMHERFPQRSVWLHGSGRLSQTMLRRAAALPEVKQLYFSHSSITDEGLALLAGMPHVTSLDLTRTEVSDAGLAHLRSWPALGSLRMGGTGVANLSELRSLTSLMDLSLGETSIDDRSLANLSSLDNLYRLDLTETHITDVGLPHLAGLWRLTHLDLAGTQISDAGLVHLACLTNLHTLNLQRTKVTGQGLGFLAGLDLQVLGLDDDALTPADVAQFKTWRRVPQIYVTPGPVWREARQIAEKAGGLLGRPMQVQARTLLTDFDL